MLESLILDLVFIAFVLCLVVLSDRLLRASSSSSSSASADGSSADSQTAEPLFSPDFDRVA